MAIGSLPLVSRLGGTPKVPKLNLGPRIERQAPHQASDEPLAHPGDWKPSAAPDPDDTASRTDLVAQRRTARNKEVRDLRTKELADRGDAARYARTQGKHDNIKKFAADTFDRHRHFRDQINTAGVDYFLKQAGNGGPDHPIKVRHAPQTEHSPDGFMSKQEILNMIGHTDGSWQSTYKPRNR